MAFLVFTDGPPQRVSHTGSAYPLKPMMGDGEVGDRDDHDVSVAFTPHVCERFTLRVGVAIGSGCAIVREACRLVVEDQ
jgi:hypothetical protein